MTTTPATQIRNRSAFITGASSGIGAAFARRLAAEGYHLVLTGRRQELLAQLCAELQQAHGIHAEYLLGELSRPEEVLVLEQRLRQIPDLAVLINNAGGSTIGDFADGDLDVQEAMIRVHAVAPVRFTHAALQGMVARREGSIINVASVAAFMVAPGNATYCAVKGYLASFSQSLALELKGTGVRVQALCPGFVRSDFHERMGYEVNEKFFRGYMTAETVVDASLRDLARGKVVCIPGIHYRAAVALSRIVPRPVLYRAATRFIKRRDRKLRNFSG
jgi:uncharacterized protein